MQDREITAQEAKRKIQAGAAVADVRTPGEFENRHIKGALLLPSDDLRQEAERLLPDKDAEIIVYCQTGIRSRRAAAQLKDMGYTRIWDLGSILAWPYETEQGAFLAPQ